MDRTPKVDISSTMLPILALIFIQSGVMLLLVEISMQPYPSLDYVYAVPQSYLILAHLEDIIRWIPFASLPVSIIITYLSGPYLILRKIKRNQVPFDERTRKATLVFLTSRLRLKKEPDVILIHEDAPNAFLVGVWPWRPTLVFTDSIMHSCTEETINVVTAHELAHMSNKDMSFMTWATAFVSGAKYWSIPFFFSAATEVIIGGVVASASGSEVQWLNTTILTSSVALIMIWMAFYVSAFLVTAFVSRRREFLADTKAATLFDVDTVISALRQVVLQGLVQTSIAPSFLSFRPHYNMKRGFSGAIRRLFRAHPTISDRFKNLKQGTYLRYPSNFYLPSYKFALLNGLYLGLFFVSSSVVFSDLDFVFSRIFMGFCFLAMAVNLIPTWYTDWSWLKKLGARQKVKDFFSIVIRNFVSMVAITITFIAILVLFSIGNPNFGEWFITLCLLFLVFSAQSIIVALAGSILVFMVHFLIFSFKN